MLDCWAAIQRLDRGQEETKRSTMKFSQDECPAIAWGAEPWQ